MSVSLEERRKIHRLGQRPSKDYKQLVVLLRAQEDPQDVGIVYDEFCSGVEAEEHHHEVRKRKGW